MCLKHAIEFWTHALKWARLSRQRWKVLVIAPRVEVLDVVSEIHELIDEDAETRQVVRGRPCLCEECGEGFEAWHSKRFCQPCWGAKRRAMALAQWAKTRV